MLTYTFDDRGDESLYAHLYHCMRTDIELGVIAPDEKLPSKRPFAKHLGVSLITVEGAYTQLAAEGYIRSVPRVGYFANRLQQSGHVKAAPSKTWQGVSEPQKPGGLPPSFSNVKPCAPLNSANLGASVHTLSDAAALTTPPSPVLPSPTLTKAAPLSPTASTFPLTAWSRVLRDVLAHEPEHELTQESPSMGLPRLQKALAQHVRAFRGLEVNPEQILVASGAQSIYSLLIQLIGRNTPMAIENPGYPRLAHIYCHNGVPLTCIDLDDDGVNMEQLRASGAQAVHLMPSHQFPTGIVTPISRRYELLSWATEEPGRYIIEDDYDCEFRLTGRPIPTMKSIDTEDCVIYTNTFTRSLGPSFRVGYAVLPQHLLERYQHNLAFYSCTVSTIEQITLARFIESGELERHINRTRTRCRTQRDRLQAALEAAGLAQTVTLQGAEAGLHFLLTVSAPCMAGDVKFALQAARISATPLSQYYVGEENAGFTNPASVADEGAASACFPTSYVISYADLTDEAIERLVEKLRVL